MFMAACFLFQEERAERTETLETCLFLVGGGVVKILKFVGKRVETCLFLEGGGGQNTEVCGQTSVCVCTYHWGQNDYLPNSYSGRIILGNSMRFLCAQEKFQGNQY